jgi:LPS-assembly protein
MLVLRVDKTFRAMPAPVAETPVFIEADDMHGKKGNQLEATGDALLRDRRQTIKADRLLYLQESRFIDANGSVVLELDGSTMSGPHLELNLDTNIGEMEHPDFYIAENGARGSADILRIADRQHFELDNASYTTCPAGNRDWLMKMQGLEIDRDRQIGIAHQAWVEFMGVPILYTPWMDFPLNDQRKSGFLSPIMGGTSQGGSELTLPYYWNIAPDMDATIAPRVMKKRGVMLNNEFRYLEKDFGGEVHLDVLPNDALSNSNRGRFSLKHNQLLATGLNGYVNLNRVSDDAYYRDLADTVNATSQVNLPQEGGVNYSAGWWNTAVRMQRYQTLQDINAPIIPPYARLPQISVNAQQKYAGANVAFAGEFVDFTHPTLISGQRLVLNPSISYPLYSDPGFYLTPKVALHSTNYLMGENNTTALPNTTRILPILSADSGLSFERDWNLWGSDYLNTLEPRAFYVYVPYKNQNLLPNYDTAQADFGFTQMFAENRFFGSDRVGDANQITLAATSRLLDPSNGIERFKLMVGERFSLKTPKVNLVAPTETTNKSDILLAASGHLTRTWSFESEYQYNPNQSQTQRYNAAINYRSEAGKVFNLGYRFTRETLGTLIQGALPAGAPIYTSVNGVSYPSMGGVPYTVIGGLPYSVVTGGLRSMDISGQWPLSAHWHAVGRFNYSLLDGKTLESIAGLEYNQNCWGLRLVAQRYAVATQQANTGLFLQLELNDFVKVGSDPLAMLKKSISGYTKLNNNPVDKSSSVLR